MIFEPLSKAHNVESLRTQPRAQEQAADAADDILARVAGIFGPAPVSLSLKPPNKEPQP
jgi:hypothetical protein